MNGSINTGLDNSDDEDEMAEKYQNEDMFKPYNQYLKEQGITFNEWKDKKYDWDLRV